MHGNGEVAPIPAVRRTLIESREPETETRNPALGRAGSPHRRGRARAPGGAGAFRAETASFRKTCRSIGPTVAPLFEHAQPPAPRETPIPVSAGLTRCRGHG